MEDILLNLINEQQEELQLAEISEVLTEISKKMDVISCKIDGVNNKLDQLIKAPYKQAVLHLKEREVEKAKDCLIEAISNDCYDISANLLYISILCYLKKVDVAVRHYWELYEKFTFRAELFPEKIYETFLSITKNTHIPMIKTLSIIYSDNNKDVKFYPRQVCIFISFFCIIWERKKKFTNKKVLKCYDWGGHCIFTVEGSDPQIISISYKFIVCRVDNNKIVYDIQNKNIVNLKDYNIDISTFKVSDHKLFSKYILEGSILKSEVRINDITVHSGIYIREKEVNFHYEDDHWSADETYIKTYEYGNVIIKNSRM